jgi:cephalosporin hydroxylase
MMAVRDRIRDVAFRMAPGTTARALDRRREGKAWLLRKRLDRAGTLEKKVDLAIRSTHFQANQKRTEILELLRLVQRIAPARLCEIGTAQGGTLALFSQVAAPNATILSIDINYRPEQIAANRHLVGRGQALFCLAADSHAGGTAQQVRDLLDGADLDFLFIDGDHSLDGVSADFRMYAPLVRSPGGIIALHDIVPDFRTRHGIDTGADVGQVPEFWAQLRMTSDVIELIENPEQDGMGIGVVRQGSEAQGWDEGSLHAGRRLPSAPAQQGTRGQDDMPTR